MLQLTPQSRIFLATTYRQIKRHFARRLRSLPSGSRWLRPPVQTPP